MCSPSIECYAFHYGTILVTRDMKMSYCHIFSSHLTDWPFFLHGIFTVLIQFFVCNIMSIAIFKSYVTVSVLSLPFLHTQALQWDHSKSKSRSIVHFFLLSSSAIQFFSFSFPNHNKTSILTHTKTANDGKLHFLFCVVFNEHLNLIEISCFHLNFVRWKRKLAHRVTNGCLHHPKPSSQKWAY